MSGTKMRPPRRAIPSLSLIVLLQTLGSCHRAEPSSTSSTGAIVSNEINLDDLTLECALEQAPGTLKITYTIHNRWSRDVVVFNRIPTKDVDDTSSYSANNVYVDLDGAVLGVKLMILPLDLPPGMKIEDRPLPDTSLLKAGGSLSEQVVLTQPIKVRNPVRLRALSGGLRHDAALPNQHIVAMKPSSASELAFTVGISAIARGSKLTPVSEALPDVFMPPLLEGKQVVRTKEFHLTSAVRVLDYAVSR